MAIEADGEVLMLDMADGEDGEVMEQIGEALTVQAGIEHCQLRERLRKRLKKKLLPYQLQHKGSHGMVDMVDTVAGEAEVMVAGVVLDLVVNGEVLVWEVDLYGITEQKQITKEERISELPVK